MPPAARVTDMHVCPMVTGVVPHVGGPIVSPGGPTVLIGNLPSATLTTQRVCGGPKLSLEAKVGPVPVFRFWFGFGHSLSISL